MHESAAAGFRQRATARDPFRNATNSDGNCGGPIVTDYAEYLLREPCPTREVVRLEHSDGRARVSALLESPLGDSSRDSHRASQIGGSDRVSSGHDTLAGQAAGHVWPRRGRFRQFRSRRRGSFARVFRRRASTSRDVRHGVPLAAGGETVGRQILDARSARVCTSSYPMNGKTP